MLKKFYRKFYIIILIALLELISISAAPIYAAKKTSSLKLNIKLTKIAGLDQEIAKFKAQILSDYRTKSKQLEGANIKLYWEGQAITLLKKLLESQGYYAAIVESEFSNKDDNVINLIITPEKQYSIARITLEYQSKNPHLKMPKKEDLPVKENDFAIAKNILEAENHIYEYLQANNCLINLDIKHSVIVNKLEQHIELTFVVDAGDNANINKISFEGLKKVNPEYVRKLVPIRNGQCYQNSIIIQTQNILQKSSLFFSVTTVKPESIDENGEVPLIFQMRENKDKTAKLGLHYYTNEGIGGYLGWNHRNLFSNGEDLNIAIKGNKNEQKAELFYSKPFYLRDDQTLEAGSNYIDQDSKAFQSQELEVFGGIKRRITDILTVGLKTEYSLAKIISEKDFAITKDISSILSFPIFIQRDSRDSDLDPHNGNLLKFETIPNVRIDNKKAVFIKNKLTGTAYLQPFASKLDPVVAFKLSGGSMVGGSKDFIPKIEQFYTGGSNSVRGFEYQLATNLDNNKPIGGLSFFEANLELRTKIKGNFGVVVFFDAGTNYQKRLPDIRQKLFYGAGVGVRYYTIIGPLSADIAFPLNKRKGVDKSYQLYLNIGQSF